MDSRKTPKYPCITHLITRGSYYDVGYNVGMTFASNIKDYIEKREMATIQYYLHDEGQKFYETSLKVSR